MLQVVDIVDTHGGFNCDCLGELHTAASLPYADMQKVHLCYEDTKEPRHTIQITSTRAPEMPVALATQQISAVVDAGAGLVTFQRCPPGYHGLHLLNHSLLFIKRPTPRGERVRPSADLGVATAEDQQMLLEPIPEDLIMREILRDASGNRATKKTAQRKLDSRSALLL